jgi:hypothetical protein
MRGFRTRSGRTRGFNTLRAYRGCRLCGGSWRGGFIFFDSRCAFLYVQSFLCESPALSAGGMIHSVIPMLALWRR